MQPHWSIGVVRLVLMGLVGGAGNYAQTVASKYPSGGGSTVGRAPPPLLDTPRGRPVGGGGGGSAHRYPRTDI